MKNCKYAKIKILQNCGDSMLNDICCARSDYDRFSCINPILEQVIEDFPEYENYFAIDDCFDFSWFGHWFADFPAFDTLNYYEIYCVCGIYCEWFVNSRVKPKKNYFLSSFKRR